VNPRVGGGVRAGPFVPVVLQIAGVVEARRMFPSTPKGAQFQRWLSSAMCRGRSSRRSLPGRPVRCNRPDLVAPLSGTRFAPTLGSGSGNNDAAIP
jgi:hypothetical protein